MRWRCHESNVQRAVRAAAEQCNLVGITPHHLRHAFATHSLRDGTYVRDLQVVLGHSHLETTMLYLHTEAGRVTSPLNQYVANPTGTGVTASNKSLEHPQSGRPAQPVISVPPPQQPSRSEPPKHRTDNLGQNSPSTSKPKNLTQRAANHLSLTPSTPLSGQRFAPVSSQP